jgi:hypothetical protein
MSAYFCLFREAMDKLGLYAIDGVQSASAVD